MADTVQQMCVNATADAVMSAATACSNVSDAVELTYLGPKTSWLKQLQILTYTMPIQETYIETMDEMPDLFIKPLPLIILLVIVEAIIKTIMGHKEDVRFNNYMVNITSTALLDSFVLFFFKGAELMLYSYVYEHYRIYTLPWDKFYVYIIAFIVVDYMAYWYHRMSHEVALFWASHEYHHNTEDMNLSVSMRLPYTLRFVKWMFNLPMAIIGLPVTTMHIHTQLGFIYNGFNHLAIVPSIGKMLPGIGDVYEYIMVTPKHHRVHHSMNAYALDTNYGNVMIIWDRLHGTFAEERLDEELSFGTLTPLDSSGIIHLQHAPFETLFKKAASMEKFSDKVKTLFYGPGWFPNTPRLGNKEDLPDMRGRPKFDVQLPNWFRMYLFLNGLGVFVQYLDKLADHKVLSAEYKLFCFVCIYYSYYTLGALYDSQKRGIWMEAFRIPAFIALQTVSSLPLVVTPHFYNFTMTIACLDLLVFPFVAKRVLNRVTSGPSDKELYMKKLEQLKYVKGKKAQ